MFNFDDYKGKYAMHCQTEDEAIEFCELMHEDGFRWSDSRTYIETNLWYVFDENTCYEWLSGQYGSVSDFQEDNYEILEWSDFRNSVEANPQELLDLLGL